MSATYDVRAYGHRPCSGLPGAHAHARLQEAVLLGTVFERIWRSTMTTSAPLRARQSYRHEAFLWRDRADYLAGLVPFVVDGLDAGEVVLVGVTPQHVGWLTDALGPRAEEVQLVDMSALAHNPARIIPAVQELLAGCCGPGRPARGVGEPAWPGRDPEEVLEGQLHEALLNLAIDPDLPFWLVCPYDAAHLDPASLADAERSHPVVVTGSSYAGSGRYGGHDHARALFAADLRDLRGPDTDVRVGETTLDRAAEQVTLRAVANDLRSDQVVALNDVVRGLVVESVRRGAPHARLRMWDEPRELVCEISDATVVEDFLIGRRPPAPGRHEPVWFANQVCDLVQVRSGPRGTTVRVHVHR